MMTVQIIIPKGPTVSFSIRRNCSPSHWRWVPRGKMAEPLGSIWEEYDLNTEIINYRREEEEGAGKVKEGSEGGVSGQALQLSL